MMRNVRPLPATIAVMLLLAGVKTAGMVHAVGIGSPARASTAAAEGKPAAEGKAAAAKPADAKPGAPAKPAQAEAAPAVAPPEPQISEAERAALLDLRNRRKQLEAQAAKLDEREALLSAAERRLTERVQQLAALQTKLEQLDKERHDREEANWNGLVKTYESMRPRDAAQIFNDLDNAVLIPVLDRMKETKAAPILAAMTPERARAATSDLAKWRNRTSAAPKLDGVQESKK